MARYHPDRFAGAPPDEQAYASQRALRINAAYAALSDFTERTVYNRSLAGGAPRVTPPPQSPRDHLAELYEQAQAHLAAGRALQAAATLREVIQLNPFYKDSAVLLAQAEATARPQRREAGRGAPDQGRRALVVGGLGALALVGLGAVGWAIRGRAAGATQGSAVDVTPPAGGALEQPPTTAPSATVVPPSVTAPPLTATAAPSNATPVPPSVTAPPPTQSVTTPAGTPTPEAIAEDGPLLYAEDFGAGAGWPTLGGRGWSVGPGDDGYRIVAAASAGNIWAYNTAPAPDFLVGVDVVVAGGLAGLLLRFSEGGYLAFLINPTLGSYRLIRRERGSDTVLIEEAHPALAIGSAVANRVVARLQGDTVSLRINGRPVYELTVSAPPASARYGLIAATDDGEVTAIFSNLTLREV
jgi:hypothetical protein